MCIFSFNKCPIKIHDGAYSKFTNWDETDYSVQLGVATNTAGCAYTTEYA